MTTKQIKTRLEYLRNELRSEAISYGELFELQCLAKYIAPDDVELLEAAGVPEQLDERAAWFAENYPIYRCARDKSYQEQEARLRAIQRDTANESAPEIF